MRLLNYPDTDSKPLEMSWYWKVFFIATISIGFIRAVVTIVTELM